MRGRDFWFSFRAWARTSRPTCMGGGKTVMIGNLIQNQFTTFARLALWRCYLPFRWS